MEQQCRRNRLVVVDASGCGEDILRSGRGKRLLKVEGERRGLGRMGACFGEIPRNLDRLADIVVELERWDGGMSVGTVSWDGVIVDRVGSERSRWQWNHP